MRFKYEMKKETPRPREVWVIKEDPAYTDTENIRRIVVVLSVDEKKTVCMECRSNEDPYHETHLIRDVKQAGLDYAMFIVKQKRTIEKSSFVRKMGALTRNDMNCLT